MIRFPDPQSFAEGQRALALWLMSCAGMFAGAMICVILAILVWGGWAPDQQHTIILIIGGALGGFVLCMVAVILALAVGGPVGRFRVSADRNGATFDLDKNDAAPQPEN